MGLTWDHSVCSGCRNKMPQTRGLNNRLLFSYSLGVWKSKIKVLVDSKLSWLAGSYLLAVSFIGADGDDCLRSLLFFSELFLNVDHL